MEDSVGEEERREQGETVAQAKAHQEEARETAAAGGGEPAEEGGFLSALASKIGATMSGTNGSGGEANATAASAGEEGKRGANGEPGEESGFLSAMASKIGAAMSGANGGSVGGANAAVASDGEDKKDDGNGGGGIFHKLLSGSPPTASPASGAMATEEVKGEERGHEVAGEQAGILSTMATRIGMAMSSANGNENLSGDDAKMSNGEAFHGSKGEENEKEKGHDANGAGIVGQIISNLPSDDQAPDSDEASLLIAIIED
ncbi:hypothetical protein BAE44_0009417 [Dichanthelium oligosanthes]|uniref:Uncharacterized protein n=1 Tax=Dichanthelium oligosanthes TaxID=888268 RepID=A0A1E5VWV7_9POAL|nr:hypothetical protein BAE44_0009417 [Dichanthelium oligosanthes]